MGLSRPALAVLAAMIASTALAQPGTAFAQQSPMPPEIAGKLLELGRIIDPPNTALLYAPLQEKEPYPGVRLERDIKYGPADRNLLDVFTSEMPSTGRPVFIFVHGGAFIGGNKHLPGAAFYDNIMLWAVKNGFIGVNITYRLAPQFPWPAGVEDVATAVRWVSDKIGERGGDPARIYLMRHSAGASHVATYASHPEFWGSKGSGLAGALLVSGLYDLTGMPPYAEPSAYYGTDSALYAERSSVNGLLKTETPLMIAAAELDPPMFVEQLNMLKDRLCKSERGCVRSFLLPQHSHMSEMYSINTADTRLTSEILNFIRTGR
jgi:acetyl esterase/lipase